MFPRANENVSWRFYYINVPGRSVEVFIPCPFRGGCVSENDMELSVMLVFRQTSLDVFRDKPTSRPKGLYERGCVSWNGMELSRDACVSWNFWICVSWQAYLPPRRPPPHSRPGFARRADKAPSPYCRSRTVNPANRRDAHCKKLAMKWLSLKNFKGCNTLWQQPKWVGIIYKEWLEIKLTWRKVIIKQIRVK